MSDQEILDKINALKADYYATNNKNIIFKKQQKFDLAHNIMQSIDLNSLFKTIVQISDNVMRINYGVFKTVMNPNLYENMVWYIFTACDTLVQQCGTFQITIDLKGLTMTGVERYKGFISMLSQAGLTNGKNYLKHIDKIRLENPPFMIANMGQILLPLVDPSVKDKIIINS
jgi:hypothetical protein